MVWILSGIRLLGINFKFELFKLTMQQQERAKAKPKKQEVVEVA